MRLLNGYEPALKRLGLTITAENFDEKDPFNETEDLLNAKVKKKHLSLANGLIKC
jgi:hypothetical protein